MPHTKEDSWEIKDLSEKTIYSLEYNAGEYICDLGAEDFLKKKQTIKHKRNYDEFNHIKINPFWTEVKTSRKKLITNQQQR